MSGPLVGWVTYKRGCGRQKALEGDAWAKSWGSWMTEIRRAGCVVELIQSVQMRDLVGRVC
jgi:hypothetical protein